MLVLSHIPAHDPRCKWGAERGDAARGAGRGFLGGEVFADLLPVGLERRGRWWKLP